MRVLPSRPGIEKKRPEACQLHGAIRIENVADRVLHPGIGGNRNINGKPGARAYRSGGTPMCAGTEALFSEEEQTEEGGLQEESEHAFHGEGLADYASGEAGEVGPVGAELEFQRNACDYTCDESDAEDSCPEARGLVVGFVSGTQPQGLQHHDEGRQAHGELRKQIVERGGKCKLQAVDEKRAIHEELPRVPGGQLAGWILLLRPATTPMITLREAMLAPPPCVFVTAFLFRRFGNDLGYRLRGPVPIHGDKSKEC